MSSEHESALNKEKAVFVAASALMVWASVYLVHSEPALPGLGDQRVKEEAAPRLAPVELTSKQPLSAYLIGARGNPFAFKEGRYVVSGIERAVERVVTAKTQPPRRPTRRPSRPKRPEPKKVDPGKPPTRPKPKETKPAAAPKDPGPVKKPYELPVNFAGVFFKDDERYALLQDKQNDTYLKLAEGQEYPDLKIKVVKVTKSSVILENDEGKRFLLRDLLRQILSERLQSKEQN